MAKKITNKDRKFQKHKDKRLYRNLRDAYFETRKEEFLRTGLYNPMSFRNFLVMYMNYSVEDANSITAIYNKLDKKYKYSVNIEDEDAVYELPNKELYKLISPRFLAYKKKLYESCDLDLYSLEPAGLLVRYLSSDLNYSDRTVNSIKQRYINYEKTICRNTLL